MSQEPEDLGFELPAPARASRARVLVVAIVIVGGAFAFGYLRHGRTRDDGPLVISAASTIEHVQVIAPRPLTSDHALELPGVIKPLEETRIVPRTTGYVRRWLVDIGDKVKEGQTLAEIDTPELDAELAQARAQLAQAQAALKQVTAQRDFTVENSSRYQTLANQKLVSRAQVEQTQAQAQTDQASVAAAQANVAAQQANVHRLEELESFGKVVAPFAGTITKRSIDRGALVSPSDPSPMFTVAATDPVRVFIDVPQTVAPSIRVGAPAEVTVREYPGRKFAGKVTRTSGALDPDLHTMTTEIQVPNGDGALLPGMYVKAALTLPAPHQVLEIPATALYSDAHGLRVAVVDAHHKVHFAKITIERDTGATLWIATGLTGDEQIVKIAVPTLEEGDPVEVSAPPKRAADAGGGGGPARAAH